MVSDEERMVRVIDGGIGKMPHSSCVQGFNINRGNKISSSEDDRLGGFGCGGQPLGRL